MRIYGITVLVAIAGLLLALGTQRVFAADCTSCSQKAQTDTDRRAVAEQPTGDNGAAADQKAQEQNMSATAVLKNEHRLIKLVVASLGKLADEAEAGGKLDGEQAGLALDFFRGFTDACHHNKEEKHLFPMLGGHGLTPQQGPVAVMLAEHEQGRALVRTMAENREAAAAGDAAALALFVNAAREYGALLGAHIDKEDNVLFVMADQLLSADEQAALSGAFDRVEAEEMGEGTHERFHEIGEELVKHYGIGEAGAKGDKASGGGCHHGH